MPRVPQTIPPEVLPDVEELAQDSGLPLVDAWRVFYAREILKNEFESWFRIFTAEIEAASDEGAADRLMDLVPEIDQANAFLSEKTPKVFAAECGRKYGVRAGGPS